MDVPPWLKGISGDLEGLKPPRGIEDILGGIEDAIWLLVEALTEATRESNNLNTSLGNNSGTNTSGDTSGDGSGSRRSRTSGDGEGEGFATGGMIPARPPFGTKVRLGEREPEMAIPESKFKEMMGGGGTTTIINNNITVPVQAGIITVDEDELATVIGGSVGIAIKENRGDARTEVQAVSNA